MIEKSEKKKTLFCFVFRSLLIMPQTVSPVDPIPSPPSAKIPAGGTLCERRRHTCASLACRYGASLPERQARRQAASWEWRGARALRAQEEDLGRGEMGAAGCWEGMLPR